MFGQTCINYTKNVYTNKYREKSYESDGIFFIYNLYYLLKKTYKIQKTSFSLKIRMLIFCKGSFRINNRLTS